MTSTADELFRIPDSFWIADGDSVSDARAFARLVATAAQRLGCLGIRPGQRVLLFGPKSAGYCAMLLAVLGQGAVAVSAFPGLKPQQLDHIVADCRPSCAFTSDSGLGVLAGLPSAAGLPLARIQGDGAPGADAPPPRPVAGGEPATIIYTSGSTGRPKGVIFSRDNLLLGARSVAAYTSLQPDDRVLCVLPFSFDAGLNQFLAALVAGAGVVLADYLHPAQLVGICRRWGVTSITAVPGLWTKIADADWDGANASVRRICNTGGHLHKPLLDRLGAAFPAAACYLMYGFTEAFRCAYLDPARMGAKPGSVGRGIPYSSFAVVGQGGRLCGPGEPGELVQFGPLVSLGYWNRPEENAVKFRPVPTAVTTALMSAAGDRYRCDPAHFGRAAWSGDLVEIDHDGDLFIRGRLDDMIKANGFRISPTEIEDAALAAGLSAAVALADHTQAGDGITLVGVANAQVTQADVAAHLRRVLPTYMVPRRIMLLGDLPTNGNGKFDRNAIRSMLSREPECVP